MQISSRIAKARISGTARISQISRDLKDKGVEVYQLAEGEPDFNTPDWIINGAHMAALRGETRYTDVAGTRTLREAIAAKLKHDNNLNYEVSQIVVGVGAKQLIFNALMASLNPGDQVVVPAPYWVSYPEMVRIVGATPVIAKCDIRDGFKLTPEKLENAISERSRWVLLNSPCNPTGAVYSKTELRNLAEVLRSYSEVSILCDDIYEEIVFDDTEFATMGEVAPDLMNRTLTVNGVSKSHAMTGWRIGYAAGPVEFISAMTKIQSQTTTNAASVSQAAALSALTGPRNFLEDWRCAYQRRRDLVGHGLSRVAGLEVNQPVGAFYHFVRCDGIFGRSTASGVKLTDDIKVCEYFLNDFGVALVPGSEFGCPGFFRLCFAKSDECLEAACNGIAKAVASLN